MLLTCPPYGDLEVYSDDDRDISNMGYEEFIEIYREILEKTYAKLKDDTFIAIVVGEIRDKKGIYRNFVGDTIKAFTDIGAKYYNEIILVNSIGTLPIRAGKTFKASRKVGKHHQNVLVFVKGDYKKAIMKLETYDENKLKDLSEE